MYDDATFLTFYLPHLQMEVENMQIFYGAKEENQPVSPVSSYMSMATESSFSSEEILFFSDEFGSAETQ